MSKTIALDSIIEALQKKEQAFLRLGTEIDRLTQQRKDLLLEIKVYKDILGTDAATAAIVINPNEKVLSIISDSGSLGITIPSIEESLRKQNVPISYMTLQKITQKLESEGKVRCINPDFKRNRRYSIA
jgi:hypothetical protein